ncbi:MAG TPA: 2-amino-4-hydroxy-6-hydroxymethyldihydropteridine diphosphokinase [Bacteroidales bacterium]|nr:2-amino-4-hydroxy-6-hydroxymethyldihydropteridine diphosphokinase [Bacteroidales bacterium]
MEQAVLSLGSNLGDRMAQLRKAISLLPKQPESSFLISSVYQTSPWGFSSNDLFLNCVLAFETTLTAERLLEKCQGIEIILGRQRQDKGYVSRTMDIDILFYGDIIIENEKLIVPHPLIEKRKFVLIPLEEILPQFIHPKLQKSIHQLLEICQDKETVDFYSRAADLF